MGLIVTRYGDLEDVNFEKEDVVYNFTHCFNEIDGKVAKVFPLTYRDDQRTKKGTDLKLGTFIRTLEKEMVVVTGYGAIHIDDKFDYPYINNVLTNTIPYLVINKLIKSRILVIIPINLVDGASDKIMAHLDQLANNEFKGYEVIALIRKMATTDASIPD